MKPFERIFEYLLIAFIVLWSGGLVTYAVLPYWPVIIILLLAAYAVYEGRSFLTQLKGGYWVLTALFLVLLLQAYRFGTEFQSIIVPFLKLVACSGIALVVGRRFSERFPKFVLVLAVSSICFWVLDIFPPLHEQLLNIASTLPQFGAEQLWEVDESQSVYTLYLYTVPTGVNPDSFVFWGIPRNCGAFWEPGRFTIFLNMALMLNIFNNPEKIFTKNNVILIIVILSTFTTTGYIAMSIIMLGAVTLRKKVSSKEIFMATAFLLAVIVLSRLDFMNAKISSQMADIGNENSRFGALVYHWGQIVISPWIGFGDNLNTYFEDAMTSPCGLTDIMRYWGIPASLLLYILLYKGASTYIIKQKGQWQYILTLIVLLTLAFSQTILSSPFFYTLYFMAFCPRKHMYKLVIRNVDSHEQNF